MGICLIGTEDSRRTEYFKKAAEAYHIPVRFVAWKEAVDADLRDEIVKIDPPSYATANLFEMNEQIAAYISGLNHLEKAGCRFLNTPAGIQSVLDKRHCKEVLMKQNIPVTQMVKERVNTVEELEEVMEKHRMFSVFIKPVRCSGAAGVVAYRKYPGREKAMLYTSCRKQGRQLVNTKTLTRLERKEEIYPLLQAILSLGTIVERWHPKASHRGKSYDLRVVWQFGNIAFIVARQSSGPITNLHLNNAPLDWHELHLPQGKVEEIHTLCQDAVKLFPGLSMAGIDIMLEKGTLRPKIIEINGQGDLMYQDIFYDNVIYKQQVEYMSRLTEKKG